MYSLTRYVMIYKGVGYFWLPVLQWACDNRDRSTTSFSTNKISSLFRILFGTQTTELFRLSDASLGINKFGHIRPH